VRHRLRRAAAGSRNATPAVSGLLGRAVGGALILEAGRLPIGRRIQSCPTAVSKGTYMKKVLSTLAIIPLLAAVLPAQRPWQQITVPSVRDVAANFKAPPHEYGAIQPFTSWNGPDANERMARIVQDLDRSRPMASSW